MFAGATAANNYEEGGRGGELFHLVRTPSRLASVKSSPESGQAAWGPLEGPAHAVAWSQMRRGGVRLLLLLFGAIVVCSRLERARSSARRPL